MTRFDSIEYIHTRDGYLVQRGEKSWSVPLSVIRALKDPDYLEAVQAAAAVAKIEERA